MEIVWRRIAVDDLDEAHRYIAKDNPAAANRIRNAIIAAVERLKDNPQLGPSRSRR
jgi:plasmid stabilization system protein ParE